MDMAICLILFNPVNSKRMLMNYHYVINEFKLQRLPVFTLELVYTDRTPQIADAIHVKSNSVMFHKENMCRVLERYIPPKFTKLAFLDADVVFKDKQWYSKTSNLLNNHDIVQPFQICHWLDLTYKKILWTAQTLCFYNRNEYYVDLGAYHPGFAWCFRREWYNKYGFFDLDPIGNGDSVSSLRWFNKKFWHYDDNKTLRTLCISEYEKYCLLEDPRITYLKDSELFHLYHGSLKKRQYASRNDILSENTKPFKEISYVNSHGIYEWLEPEKWNPKFLKHFDDRDDDDISCVCVNNRFVLIE